MTDPKWKYRASHFDPHAHADDPPKFFGSPISFAECFAISPNQFAAYATEFFQRQYHEKQKQRAKPVRQQKLTQEELEKSRTRPEEVITFFHKIPNKY